MSSDNLLFTSKRDTSIDERDLPSKAECLTLEAKNKILAKHLDFSGEVDHLVPPDKLPILLEAQPALASLESLEAVDLGDDPTNPKHVHVNTTFSADERAKMIDLLCEYKDVFA
ncbi:hypothetical protein SLE2022_318400 [Rubroshorea leprosula]